jgi:hypothetical protein
MACRHWPRFPVPSMIWVGRDLRGGGLGPLWIIRQADRRWWKWNKHSMGTCGDATPARVAPAALLLASPAGWSFASGSRTRGPLSCTVHVSASHSAPGLRRRRVAFPPRPSRTTSRTGSNRAEREGGWVGWVGVGIRASANHFGLDYDAQAPLAPPPPRAAPMAKADTAATRSGSGTRQPGGRRRWVSIHRNSQAAAHT